VAKSSSPVSGVAERYAGSLLDLAVEQGSVDAVESDLGRFEALISESDDLKRLIRSPVFGAEEQFRAVSAIVERAGMSGLAANFLKVVARNRRLFAVPAMIAAYRRLAAEQRGEVAADVVSAHVLSATQEADLRAALKGIAGKDVAISVTVDPSLLGGLVVRLGSRQIDTSLRTKLNSLKLALKEVG
jgi:F-type H+-transporting ATPase subunit delta